MTKMKFSVLMLAGCMGAGCILGTPVFAEQMDGGMEYNTGENGYWDSAAQVDQNVTYEGTAQMNQDMSAYEDVVQEPQTAQKPGHRITQRVMTAAQSIHQQQNTVNQQNIMIIRKLTVTMWRKHQRQRVNQRRKEDIIRMIRILEFVRRIK